jgi:hypothetical protein
MVAKPDDWKRLPAGEAAPIPYEDTFSEAEYQRLAGGLVPEVMEDKWFAYLDGCALYFHRSWTGQFVYRVVFEQRGESYSVTEASCALDVLQRSDATYEAQLLSFLIHNLLLGERRPFPRPAGLSEQAPGIYQHAISGTGYREEVVRR